MLENSEPSADSPTVSCQCCGRQEEGIVSAWALGRAFQKRGLLRWTLKVKSEPCYHQEFHTMLLGPCSPPVSRSRPGSAPLCTGRGLQLPGCPAGSLEHCHQDPGSAAAAAKLLAALSSWATPPTVAGQGTRGLFCPRPPPNALAFPHSCLAQLPEHRGNSQGVRREAFEVSIKTRLPFPFPSTALNITGEDRSPECSSRECEGRVPERSSL